MKKSKKVEVHEETVHDFFKEEKLISLIAGYGSFERTEPGYIPFSIYRGMLFPFQVFVVSMCIAAAVISYGNIAGTIQAIHVGILVLVSIAGLILRLFADKVLKEVFQTIRSGIYRYGEGEIDGDYEQIKKKYVSQIRKMNNIFKKCVTFVSIYNSILVPLIQFMMVDEHSGQGVLNPYLPQPVYMPFNTRTFAGYTAAFIINVFFIAVVVSIVTCLDMIFVSFTLQLKAQFEILNYSLRNIEKRAHIYLRKRKPTKKEDYQSDPFSQREFQDCLYKCLTSNIQHHQSLLRLKLTFEHYLGLMFILVVAVSSFIQAAHVILILERPEIHIMANFIGTLICEMMCSLHYCWCGEELTSQSSEVYYTLYFTPWYNCDYRFKKLVSIMLSNTHTPVQINTIGFNMAASLDSFGSIISTMYQVMNIVRNTK